MGNDVVLRARLVLEGDDAFRGGSAPSTDRSDSTHCRPHKRVPPCVVVGAEVLGGEPGVE